MIHSLPDDETLCGLLAEAGATLSVEQLQALIDGVVAAPDDYDGEAWMGLVAADPTEGLRAALATLKLAAAAASDDGLDASPAPVKYALSRVHDWFSPDVRLPLCNASEASRKAVDEALEIAGLV